MLTILACLVTASSIIIVIQHKIIRGMNGKLELCAKMLVAGGDLVRKMAEKQGIEIPQPPNVSSDSGIARM